MFSDGRRRVFSLLAGPCRPSCAAVAAVSVAATEAAASGCERQNASYERHPNLPAPDRRPERAGAPFENGLRLLAYAFRTSPCKDRAYPLSGESHFHGKRATPPPLPIRTGTKKPAHEAPAFRPRRKLTCGHPASTPPDRFSYRASTEAAHRHSGRPCGRNSSNNRSCGRSAPGRRP